MSKDLHRTKVGQCHSFGCDPDMDDIPLYPGLPKQARIDEIPEEEEELFDTVYEEIAA